MPYRDDLWHVAVKHHGIVTVAQAEDAGVPAVELRKLASRGALERVTRGVYRHRGVPTDDMTELAAAVTGVGEDAFIEGDTVLGLFDLAQVNPPKIYVGCLQRHRAQFPPQIVVTVRHDVADDDLTTYRGVRCVTVRRALLDAVTRLPCERLLEAAVMAQRKDLLDEHEASEVTGAVSRQLRLIGHGRGAQVAL